MFFARKPIKRSVHAAAASALAALPGGSPSSAEIAQVGALLDAHPGAADRLPAAKDAADRAAALLGLARGRSSAQATADAARRLDDELNRYVRGR